MQLKTKSLEDQLTRIHQLQGRFTFRLSVLSKILDQQASELLRDTELTLTAYNVLLVVEMFEALSISDISRHTLIDRAQVSRTAAWLQKRDLVAFGADSRSRRKKIVTVTAQGTALMAALAPRFEDRREDLRTKLGQEGFAALWMGLERLDEILSAD